MKILMSTFIFIKSILLIFVWFVCPNYSKNHIPTRRVPKGANSFEGMWIYQFFLLCKHELFVFRFQQFLVNC
jgi:hypothetical protein